MVKHFIILTSFLFAATFAHSQNLKLTSANNGKVIQMKNNGKFTLTLNNKGDGGYSFEEPLFDSTVIRQVSHKHISATSGKGKNAQPMVGNFGKDVWVFKVIKAKSSTQLTINIQRPWMRGKEQPIIDFEATIKTK